MQFENITPTPPPPDSEFLFFDPLSPGPEDKPYDACIDCIYMNSERCNGPNFPFLLPARRCEWLQSRRLYLKKKEPERWSYEDISERTNISLSSVVRIFTDPEHDPRASTLSRILFCLIPCKTWVPCAIRAHKAPEIVYSDSEETLKRIEELKDGNAQKQRMLDGIHESYAAELATVRAEFQRKIDHLREQVDIRDRRIASLDAKIEKQDKRIEQQDVVIERQSRMLEKAMG